MFQLSLPAMANLRAMGRTYLIFILVAGMFGAMVSNCSRLASTRHSDVAFSERVTEAGLTTANDAPSAGSSRVTEEGSVELQRSGNGHFYADVQINGATIHALVDTGATEIALSRADASSAGIATSIGMPEVIGQGADGDVHGEIVKIDRISLGNKEASDMPAVVLSAGGETLLGQSFLSKFASVEIHGDTMVLK
jgi:aspartyl protease family protein